ncbi:MAG: hypothetical protein JXQ72_01095 [Anaerolineae bacterium]|nr:hypothetical protein [Anaerolineae bacterium]
MANSAWDNFVIAAHGGQPARVPVALSVNSTFLPDFAGLNTLDFFMYPARWLDAYLALVERFPDVVFLPGFWVEHGAADEASAFGATVLWRHDTGPAIRPLDLSPSAWGRMVRPDPYTDGLMALVLRRYWNLEKNGELPDPHRIRMVAARGPFATAAHILGPVAFLDAVAAEPNHHRAVLDMLGILTDATIRFLQAQLSCLREPVGIMLLDDTVGMLTGSQFQRLAIPFLYRIFRQFEGLVRVFYTGTPCRHLLPHLPKLDFEMFHFSHLMDLAEVRASLPHRISLMGNVAPLELLGRSAPPQVVAAGQRCIARAGNRGGLVLSAGGFVVPGTPEANIDALVQATETQQLAHGIEPVSEGMDDHADSG